MEPGGMIAFETSVRIRRPLEEVFTYVSDPSNFPDWNSAVQAMTPMPARSPDAGATYIMERQLPSGRTTNTLEIVSRSQAEEFVVRTTAGPTPFVYRYRFGAQNGETVVDLDARLELSGIGALVPSLAERAVKRGVEDNLATLKRKLETHSG